MGNVMSENISTIYGSSFLLSLMPISLSIDVKNISQEPELDLEYNGTDSNVSDDNDNNYNHKHEVSNDIKNDIEIEILGKKAMEDEVEKEVKKSTESGYSHALANQADHITVNTDDERNGAENNIITIGSESNLIVIMKDESSDISNSVKESESTTMVKITEMKDINQSSSFLKNKCTISGYVSRVGTGIGRSDNDRQFIFCNGRPVDLPKFSKVLNEVRSGYSFKYFL